MRIAFFGTTRFSAVILRALIEHRAGEIIAVVTQPDRPAGRGRRLQESEVKRLAAKLGVAVHAPEDPNAAQFVWLLKSLEADLFAVAAYGHIFGPSLLAAPSRGCINVHASLLPRYRGAAPIHHALINGETETGITTMWMDERMDAGDMILQRALPIAPEDNVETLERKLAELGAAVLLETLRLIERGEAPRLKQDESQATYAPSLTRARAQIDWSLSAQRIIAMVRGTNPSPGAHTFHRRKRLKVLRARAWEKPLPQEGTPAAIVETSQAGVLVKAGAGAVLLTQVQPEGGRPMSGAEYARGYKPERGEVLGGAHEQCTSMGDRRRP
jgi:methionyl-tRNA formyltransferase